MGDDEDGAGEPGRERAVAHVARVDDETCREIEHLAGEMEVLGPVLPERRDALVEHRVAEQPPHDSTLALHRVEVPVPVAAPDRQSGHEMVKHEVVEDDDPGRPAQRFDDPAMGIGVVADLVHAEVGSTRRLLRSTLDDDDVAPLPERRHEQRGIVGDPGALRWHRAEERDSHDSNRSIARSQVTSTASARPARP